MKNIDMNIDNLKNLTSDILQEAKRLGATACEAGISSATGLSVTVRLGEIDTLEFHKDKGLELTLYKDKRKGSISCSDFSWDAIKDAIQAAADIAEYTQEDSCSGLADQTELAQDIPDCDLHHPWDMSAVGAIQLAKSCEAAALGFDKRITNSEGASLSTHSRLYVYGTSHGFLAGYASTRHSLSCSVIGQDGQVMQRDHDYTTARHATELFTPEFVGKSAAEKTIKRLNPQQLKTASVPVIFTPNTARGLLGHFISAISGGSLYRKSSFLLDTLGKAVFPTFMELHEKPFIKKGLGSAPFDGEGVAPRERALVSQGILQSYVLSSYSARKLGMKTTGNQGGVHNLIVQDTGLSFAALLQKMQTGLLVTELMGPGVNLVTGDYSRGATGFWVENGVIQYPVAEITIAGNLKDMFQNIVDIGNDIDKRGNILTGSILLEAMMVAGL